MRRRGLAVIAAALALALGGAIAAQAKHPAIARVERAIAIGEVEPARDLAPVLEALQRSRSVDEKRELVDAIAGWSEADGDAPNAVKRYLLDNAPPVLLDVIQHGANNFLQGDAVTALRDMHAPKAVLERAAALAEADPDSYVQSRGEILRSYIRSLPDEDAAAARRATDPAAAQAGVTYLDRRGITVSTEALRDAARRADADAVKGLLDAGVAPDTGVTDLAQTPIYFAVAQGCYSQGAETDWLIQTIELLIQAGADLSLVDDNKNTVLMSAAQYCGPRTINALVAGGARVDVRNGSGISPLAMALIMSKFDAAEALVARGARLTQKDAPMVSGVTDPRGKAIVARAMGKGKP